MKNIIGILGVMILILFVTACEKDYNDWKVDSSYDRLFKSIIFDASAVQPTSVEIKFTKSIGATKYVFEFSKDSLQFNTIVERVELLADTLTPFANSSDQSKIEYRQTFDELDGTTGYSVRMKSIDEASGKESKYSQIYFVTSAEQLFKGYNSASSTIGLNWTINPRVTNISLYDEASTLVQNIVLTEQQKAEGTAQIANLKGGTTYTAKIFNGTALRGSLPVKTTGIFGSTTYKVLLTDTASSIGTALQGLVAGGAKDITVEFGAGESYSIGGDVTIPSGVNNIAFSGAKNNNGVLTNITNIRFRVQDKINNLMIQNLTTTSADSFFIDLGTKVVNDILVEGCTISKLNSIVRVSGTSVIGNIIVNNCLVSQTGGYGVMNVGAGGTVKSINVTNCTLTEINTRFADVRVKTSINFRNITCVNVKEAMGHLWNFDNNFPVLVSIQNCIIAGPNGATALSSTSGTYNSITINYGGNYKTKDVINGTRPMTGITEVPLNIADFFVNPTIGDYHIKPGIGFAGTGVAGDPRWF
ncbi:MULTISPECIES: DUF5123 domain-containing protein [Flavobacterium]|uniref:DUF5123 domain-containing protein n=1 Tax=Flavobacterium TaxID=237 RepID=UPI0011821381|nr:MULTISPECIES: DUF5123 domain-containing protein [Flavobacterium]MCR4029684.1 DUF5123 domain-containing protein [Flavobacterium panacis]